MTFKMTKVDPLTNKVNTATLPITMTEYLAWRDGDMVIQKAFPHLTDDQREFMMTGIMPESWDELFTETETSKGTEPDEDAAF